MDTVEKINIGNFTAKIMYDHDTETPREWCNLGNFIARGKHSHLGDAHELDFSECDSWDDEEKVIRKEFGRDCIMLPVYGYSHGQLTIATTPYYCNWDSGRLGTIVVSRNDIRDEFSVKRISPKLKNQILKQLDCEIKTMDKYLTGDVYYFEIVENMVDDEGDDYEEDRDSCGGHYGLDYTREEVNQILKGYVEEQNKVMGVQTEMELVA